MKLIVAGSTGFVATEVIRQALALPAITSIVALARRPTPVPENVTPGADVTKLKSVACEDFGNYPVNVKKELAEADACIWLLAVTIGKASKMGAEELRKICLDYTVTGMETISRLPRESAGSKPFRFIYTSGSNTSRDPSKKPWIMGEYSLMRGEVESRVLEFGKASGGTVETCVTKPGLITSPAKTGPVMKAVQTVMSSIIGLPSVELKEIAATLIEQAVNGAEKDTLLNEDLVRIGRKALVNQEKGASS